jgi:hypothetical protein
MNQWCTNTYSCLDAGVTNVSSIIYDIGSFCDGLRMATIVQVQATISAHNSFCPPTFKVKD